MGKLPAPDAEEIGEDECLMCGSDDTRVFDEDDYENDPLRECFTCGYQEAL